MRPAHKRPSEALLRALEAAFLRQSSCTHAGPRVGSGKLTGLIARDPDQYTCGELADGSGVIRKKQAILGAVLRRSPIRRRTGDNHEQRHEAHSVLPEADWSGLLWAPPGAPRRWSSLNGVLLPLRTVPMHMLQGPVGRHHPDARSGLRRALTSRHRWITGWFCVFLAAGDLSHLPGPLPIQVSARISQIRLK